MKQCDVAIVVIFYIRQNSRSRYMAHMRSYTINKIWWFFSGKMSVISNKDRRIQHLISTILVQKNVKGTHVALLYVICQQRKDISSPSLLLSISLILQFSLSPISLPLIISSHKRGMMYIVKNWTKANQIWFNVWIMICPTNGPLKHPENKTSFDVVFFKCGMCYFHMRCSDCFDENFTFLLPLCLGQWHRHPLVMVHIGSGNSLVP